MFILLFDSLLYTHKGFRPLQAAHPAPIFRGTNV